MSFASLSVPERNPLSITLFDMSDQSYDHTWTCFGWDFSDPEQKYVPCTSNQEVTAPRVHILTC